MENIDFIYRNGIHHKVKSYMLTLNCFRYLKSGLSGK